MPRLLFEKTGSAVWISHLDLMRLFQRAFKRAGLPLTHTQGFNPRPSVSIAMPLSVGISSCCELLDFDLDGETVPDEEICVRLNQSLIAGVRVLSVYREAAKIRDLALLECELTLEYDAGVPAGTVDQLRELFSRDDIPVEKKSKKGIEDQNIKPMIRRISIEQTDDREVQIHALICCQNPTLNPMQIHGAVARHLPDLTPSFASCRRLEIFDAQGKVFR